MKAKLIGLGLAAALLVPTTAEAIDMETLRTICFVKDSQMACDIYFRAYLDAVHVAETMMAEGLGFDHYEVARVCLTGTIAESIDAVREKALSSNAGPDVPAPYVVYATAMTLYPCGAPL